MTRNVLFFQSFLWTVVTTAHCLFGGWGLALSAIFVLLATGEVRKTSLWWLQMISMLCAILVNAWWPELSVLGQAELNEAFGLHLELDAIRLAWVGFSASWVVMLITGFAAAGSDYRGSYYYRH